MRKKFERMTKEARLRVMTDTLLDLAARHNLYRITYRDIAGECDCTHGLVRRYFGNQESMQEKAIEEAVRRGNATVVAQGLAMGSPAASRASESLKKEAASLIRVAQPT